MEHDDEDERLRALTDASARLARGDAGAVEPLIAAHVALGFGELEARRFCEATARAVLEGDTSAALEEEIADAERAMILTVEDAGARFELLAKALPQGVAVRREARRLHRRLSTSTRALGFDSRAALVRGLEAVRRFDVLARATLGAIQAGRKTSALMIRARGALQAIPEGTALRAEAASFLATLEELEAQARGGAA